MQILRYHQLVMRREEDYSRGAAKALNAASAQDQRPTHSIHITAPIALYLASSNLLRRSCLRSLSISSSGPSPSPVTQ
ncbi:hypothetical protein E2C01_053340 [Portunus trituberculatus]|uniref:Uncharacterized protein n=1 Tax=Portunus trituberculatus TaxID=210409 RepID=A0A5B7GK19_PORTR|nr:hypothetical protein [Portunus trituberculatus]